MTIEAKRSRWLIGASFTALLCAPLSAMAQDAAKPAAPADDQFVQEIIVTAQRRSENKQDVPVTLTVLGGEQLQAARVQSVQDIVSRTPGFGFDAYPASEPRLSVRGIGSSARGAGGDPSTAIFIDEIYYGRPAAITFETFDVSRVEVLKGPQGTLFGRNVSGGAVSVVTNPADPSGFDAEAQATYGNYDRTEVAAFVNTPLANGKAAFRATGTWRKHDGYVDRVVGGKKVGDVDDQDAQYGRVQFYAEPSDSVRIDIKADYARDRAHGPGNRAIIDLGSGGLSGRYTLNPNRGQNAATFDGQQDRDTWGVRGNVQWDLSFATLAYLGSYRDLDYYSFYDFDGTAPNPARSSRDITGGNREDSQFYSHELQIRSLPGSKVIWVAGLYDYKADTSRDNLAELSSNGALQVRDYIDQDATTKSKAIYADVTVPLSETISVFGGLRYTNDKKTIHSIGDTNAPGTFYVVGDAATPGHYNGRGKDSWNAVTWRAGASWHVTPDFMLYASAARGFKSGGYQDTPTDSLDSATAIAPEFATNFEFGQRGAFFNRRVIWNNSLYFTKYTDLQTRISTGLGFRAESASAEIYGLESELNLRLAGGFSVAATYAYTHARYTKFITFEDGVNADYAGNHLTRVPDHKFTITPSYKRELPGGATAEVAVDYAYESKIYDDHSNKPPAIRKPTEFIDARLVLTAPDRKLSLSIWGKNLTNELTRTYQGDFGGILFAAYNPPKTYGATVRWKY